MDKTKINQRNSKDLKSNLKRRLSLLHFQALFCADLVQEQGGIGWGSGEGTPSQMSVQILTTPPSIHK